MTVILIRADQVQLHADLTTIPRSYRAGRQSPLNQQLHPFCIMFKENDPIDLPFILSVHMNALLHVN